MLRHIVHDLDERRSWNRDHDLAGGRRIERPSPPAVGLAHHQPGDPCCLDANDVVNRSPPNVRKLCAHVLHRAEEYSEGQWVINRDDLPLAMRVIIIIIPSLPPWIEWRDDEGKKKVTRNPPFGRTSQFPSLKRVESGAVKRARIKSSHIRHRKNTVSFFFPPGEVSTGEGEGNVNPDLMSREAFFFFFSSLFLFF